MYSDLDLSNQYTQSSRMAAIKKYLSGKQYTPSGIKKPESWETYWGRKGPGIMSGLSGAYAFDADKINRLYQESKTKHHSGWQERYPGLLKPWQEEQSRIANDPYRQGMAGTAMSDYWKNYQAKKPESQVRRSPRSTAYMDYLRGSVY